MSEMSLSDVMPGMQQQGPPQGGRRAANRARQKRRKRRRRRTVVVLALLVVLVGGGVAASWAGLAPVVRGLLEPKDYTGAGAGEVKVKILPGSSGRAIARVLAEQDVVKTEQAFVDAASEDTRAASIQPGTYAMRLQMSGGAAVTQLLDPAARLTLSVTVPEGKRVRETLDLISEQVGLPRKDLQDAAEDPASVGLRPALAKGSLEGFLFPATYDFEPDVTAVEALGAMVRRSEQALRDTGVPEDRWRELVTKASIVQKEAGRAADMPKVARVVENRLVRGIPLQLDSTVSFAVGRFEITTTPAERAVDSPYNTYRVKGLPAGPIASPGEEALQAALTPQAGPWLFFVTVDPDTGETRFAATAAEHDANVKIFQAWLRRQ